MRMTAARVMAVFSASVAMVVLVTCNSTPSGTITTQPAASRPSTQPSTQPGARGIGARGRGSGAGAGAGFAQGRGGPTGRGRGRGGGGGVGVTRPEFPFLDASLTFEERLDDLIPRLTLEQKIAQMQMDAPAIEELGIAAYHWWNEALHGVGRNGEATVFPQAIGMAATWNPELHQKMANVIGVEGRAKHAEAIRLGYSAQYAGLDFWSPNINIFRDPRWGRGQETYGEDPYLTGRMGIAFVKGLQGDNADYFLTIATPKHYAVHSGPEMERHRFDADVSEIDLWTTYLPAFEATIREGHAYSIMGAYNRVGGASASASPKLLNEILRQKWGFKGYVVSDVDSVRDVFINHQIADTPEAAAALAVKAGCDLNSGTTYVALAGALRLGLLTEADIDKSVRRLFLARIRMGEFDAPDAGFDPYASIPPTANDTREHDTVALEVARQSMVLLKNENNTLPLKKNLRSIAVIGPTADSVAALLGNYAGTPSKPITILQGVRNTVSPQTRINFVQGSPLVAEELPLAEPIPASCFFTDESKRVKGLFGTYYRSMVTMDRPIRTRVDASVDLAYPDRASQDSLPFAEGFYARWEGILVPPQSGDYQIGFTGRDAYRLTLDGKAVVDEFFTGNRRTFGNTVHLEEGKSVRVLAEYFHPAGAVPAGGAGGGGGGRGGGNAARDNAAIQLRWTRPTIDGHPAGVNGEPLFADAVRAARESDATILVLGITADLEREEASVHYAGFSGGDRTSLDLPSVQEQLLKAVTEARGNKPLAVVLTSGSALSVNWANDHAPAILQAWYPGQHGDAAADVLFGNYNPGGRLPVTFYKSVDDLPPFTSYQMTTLTTTANSSIALATQPSFSATNGMVESGRTYRYFSGKPLYPFGYGLSYTTFAYSGLSLSPPDPTTKDDIIANVTVKNTGRVAGDETVQLYLNREPVINGSRVLDQVIQADNRPPHKTLLGFLRTHLEPGEQKIVQFTITPHQLALPASDGSRHVNATPNNYTFTIQAGGSSEAGINQPLKVTGESAAPEYRFVAPKILP